MTQPTFTDLGVPVPLAGAPSTTSVASRGEAGAAEAGDLRRPTAGSAGEAGHRDGRPPAVVGLDLSLTATGIATPNGVLTFGLELKETATQWDRLIRIRQITGVVGWHCERADLVVIEGPAFSRATGGAHERAGLWWRVYNQMAFEQCGRVVVVGPTQVKKYATGKGGASKAAMVAEAIRRLGYAGHDDNEADALWLRAMALDHYGHPLCPMPAVNRAALAKVHWPELTVTP